MRGRMWENRRKLLKIERVNKIYVELREWEKIT